MSLAVFFPKMTTIWAISIQNMQQYRDTYSTSGTMFISGYYILKHITDIFRKKILLNLIFILVMYHRKKMQMFLAQ
jgi:hypothetical protein